MANLCGSCIFLDLNDIKWGEYYCKNEHKRRKVDDTACSSFRRATDNASKSSNSDGYQRSGCYITTIICDILGYADDCEVLNLLRSFRDTVLKVNINYWPVLQEYDQIGPMIAEALNQDENKKRFAAELLQNFILPCSIAIKAGNVDEAVAIYSNMVTMLRTKYGFINTSVDYSYPTPIEILGKGRIRISNDCPSFN